MTTPKPQPPPNTVLLAQMIDVERGEKQRSQNEVDLLRRQTTRAANAANSPMRGVTRDYRPRLADDTEVYPSERVEVQVKVEDVFRQIADRLTTLFDVVATRENGNTIARGDIKVGDVVVAPNVPVTYMLFLEKQLNDILKIVSDLPTLTPNEQWTYNPQQGVYETPVRVTQKSVKIPFPFIKVPADGKFPAQAETMYKDEIKGYWDTVLFSGEMEPTRVLQLTRRVEALIRAVKSARSLANATPVPQVKVGQQIFDYLLAP